MLRYALAILLAVLTTSQLLAANNHKGLYEIHLELLGTSPTSERPDYLARPTIQTLVNHPFLLDISPALPADPQFAGPPLRTGIRFEGIFRPSANGQIQLQATLHRSEEIENEAGVTLVHQETVDLRMTLQGAEIDPKLAAQQPPQGRTVKLSESRSLVILVRPVISEATETNPRGVRQSMATPSTAPWKESPGIPSKFQR
ncbi:hypothetical protein [Blastopirellula marina]|uniref:Uncharacterized protein n=1 Tax=Blastopirellula marina DSM 3645 TaxID=314230 RepID=A3ZQA9_9BACT|nr:hypothetical protein [Blastopirellula marina]EAQ81385.1 hypothetical protein DSM3645_23376 [Blastopirellula marina DSM 3645]